MEQLLKKAKADVAAQNGYASWSSIMHKVLFLEEVAQQYAELCLQEVRRRIDGAWSFDNNQTHTHNWHTKQDFLEWLDKYAGQPGDDGWIPVTDVDRLPKNSDDWYIVARGEIIGLIGHHYLNGSWFGYGCATATEGITHFRKFPEGAENRMEVMEGFYTDYHVRSYKEKEGYFPEEYIKRIETFLRNEFPVAFFRKRHKENAGYRQSICYLLECFRINIGPSRIGKMFNQNHATVIHSRKVVSEEWLECAGYEDKVEILKIVKVKLMPFLVHMEFEFKNQ